LNGGQLEFGPNCVFLTNRGERELVIWPSVETSWDDATRTIVFRSRDGVVHLLQAGQQVSFGGGGFSEAEDGRASEIMLAGIDWVSPPQPECITAEIWFVGEVVSP
jgi:hypothetical protein